jgi:hypothetical protein
MTGVALSSAEQGISLPAVRRRVSVEAVVAVLIVGVVALVLTRPWEAVPFPIVDFGGWLVLLSSSATPVDAFRALVQEHAREGRVNFLSLAYVVANWEMFGANAAGWQLLRATIMLVNVGLAYALFRTLGARQVAALVGASFFVVTDSARSVWYLPQAMEHIGACLALIAANVAAHYHGATRRGWSVAAIATTLVLAVWVREPMVAVVPFVLLVGLCHRGAGTLRVPRVDRGSVLLVSVIAAAILVFNVIPVVAVRSMARTAAYASRFGLENLSVDNATNVLFALTLPVTRVPLFPANAMFALAILLAAVGALPGTRRYRAMLLAAATLPLCAAMIYVMWPSFPGNYALPYVAGIALAFALAITTLWDGGRLRRGVAVASACAVLGYGALLMWNGRREYAAARFLDGAMARVVADHPEAHLVAAVDDPVLAGEFARGLALYARATSGASPTQADDRPCGDAAKLVAEAHPNTLVVRPPDACAGAAFPPPSVVVRQSTSIVDWKTLRLHHGETSASFWEGGSGS